LYIEMCKKKLFLKVLTIFSSF